MRGNSGDEDTGGLSTNRKKKSLQTKTKAAKAELEVEVQTDEVLLELDGAKPEVRGSRDTSTSGEQGRSSMRC